MRSTWWPRAALSLLLMLPLCAQALERAEIDHLFGRVAFAARPGDYVRFSSLDRGQVIDRLVDEALDEATLPPPPDWGRRPWDWRRTTPHPVDAVVGSRQLRQQYHQAIRGWLAESMLNDPAPLRQRMLLFWMDYLAFAATDYSPHTVWDLLDLHAVQLGDYRELLRVFAGSAHVDQRLNLSSNHKDRVNENFSRELLELYSLGPGHYRQSDVREAARAFTGQRYIARAGISVEWPAWHDYGTKEFLGLRGRLDGRDVLDRIAEQPVFAVFLIERLWREFLSPFPDPAAVRRLATGFRKDFDLARLLRALLREPAFWVPENRLGLVKSPLELVVGDLRRRDLRGAHGVAINAWAASMSQRLLTPPDVKGWRGHQAWLTVGNWEARLRFADFLGSGPTPGVPADDLAGMSPSMAMAEVGDSDVAEAVEALWHALVQSRMSEAADPVSLPLHQFR